MCALRSAVGVCVCSVLAMAPTLGAEPVTGTGSDLEKRFESLSRTYSYTQGSDLEKA